MSYKSDNPVAIVDIECNPPVVIIRYSKVEHAEWFLGYLAEHGGTETRAKVKRGGYVIKARKQEGRKQ